MLIELALGGVQYAGSVEPVTGPIPNPTPVPGPTIPTPPPSGILRWDLHPVSLWPVPPLTGSGDRGISVQFIADATRFPNGVEIGLVDESQPSKGKDFVISATPYDFTPVSPQATKPGSGSTGGPIYCRFGPIRPRTFWGVPLPNIDVPLTPGQAYYINVRASDRGACSAQFVATNRTD